MIIGDACMASITNNFYTPAFKGLYMDFYVSDTLNYSFSSTFVT